MYICRGLESSDPLQASPITTNELLYKNSRLLLSPKPCDFQDTTAHESIKFRGFTCYVSSKGSGKLTDGSVCHNDTTNISVP